MFGILFGLPLYLLNAAGKGAPDRNPDYDSWTAQSDNVFFGTPYPPSPLKGLSDHEILARAGLLP